jgi:hypothetical protein
MSAREMGWSRMEWIHLAQNMNQLKTLVNTVINLRIP